MLSPINFAVEVFYLVINYKVKEDSESENKSTENRNFDKPHNGRR